MTEISTFKAMRQYSVPTFLSIILMYINDSNYTLNVNLKKRVCLLRALYNWQACIIRKSRLHVDRGWLIE
jgi:hypothetical protein